VVDVRQTGAADAILHSHLGTDHCSLKLFSFWKQLYFKMTGIRIKICRQTGAYGKVPQNRLFLIPRLIFLASLSAGSEVVVVEGQGGILP